MEPPSTESTESATDTLRSLVRPIVTVMFSAHEITMSILQREVAPQLTAMTAGMIAWWFYDRTRMHQAEQNHHTSE